SRHLGRTLQVPARLIVPDRPGYGLSDPKPGRSVQDWSLDALQLMDRLGLGSFYAFGISGGAPYVCAICAAAPDRVQRGAIFSGIGPLYLPNALQGMDPVQAAILRVARRAPRAIGALVAQQAQHAVHDPEATVRQIISALPEYRPNPPARVER
ncbi:alpha/beta hydrolase fold protein, partial [mine drainage metagenome]